MGELSDTDPKIERILDEMWRKTSAGEKIIDLFSMIEAARGLAEIGIKNRCPNASEKEIKRLVAEHFLGKDLSGKASSRLAKESLND
jgi:hypothetical protein